MAIQKQQQKILRTLMRNASNKKCADCGEQCAVNVDVTHGIFVCTNCSGIHREFGDRIKSVSMATFTQDEINTLQQQTNDDVNKVWMAKWTSSDLPLPLNADDVKRRTFLNAKYQEKRWYSRRAAAAASNPAPPPAATAQTAQTGPVAPQQVDLFGSGAPASRPTPAARPAPAAAPAWSPFDPSAGGQPAQPAQPAGGGLDDLLNFDMGGSGSPQVQEQQQQQQHRNDLLNLLGNMGPPQPTGVNQANPNVLRGGQQQFAGGGFPVGFGTPPQGFGGGGYPQQQYGGAPQGYAGAGGGQGYGGGYGQQQQQYGGAPQGYAGAGQGYGGGYEQQRQQYGAGGGFNQQYGGGYQQQGGQRQAGFGAPNQGGGGYPQQPRQGGDTFGLF